MSVEVIEKLKDISVGEPPELTYGLKESAITKRNRTSLVRMGTQILSVLLDTSSNRTSNKRLRVRRQLHHMINRFRYYRHIRRRESSRILQVAKRFKIKLNNKIDRPCFVWEDSPKQEISIVCLSDVLNRMLEENCDIDMIEQLIYEADISDEE